MVCPIAWWYYGRWRRFTRQITSCRKGGHIVFYRNGILFDDLFVIRFRSNGLTLSTSELLNIDQQLILRLHLLTVHKEKMILPAYIPCHVDIFVPTALQESKKNLESMIEFLNNNLSQVSEDDNEDFYNVLENESKTTKIMNV